MEFLKKMPKKEGDCTQSAKHFSKNLKLPLKPNKIFYFTWDATNKKKEKWFYSIKKVHFF